MPRFEVNYLQSDFRCVTIEADNAEDAKRKAKELADANTLPEGDQIGIQEQTVAFLLDENGEDV